MYYNKKNKLCTDVLKEFYKHYQIKNYNEKTSVRKFKKSKHVSIKLNQ